MNVMLKETALRLDPYTACVRLNDPKMLLRQVGENSAYVRCAEIHLNGRGLPLYSCTDCMIRVNKSN